MYVINVTTVSSQYTFIMDNKEVSTKLGKKKKKKKKLALSLFLVII